jgi:hypothetical protein
VIDDGDGVLPILQDVRQDDCTHAGVHISRLITQYDVYVCSLGVLVPLL